MAEKRKKAKGLMRGLIQEYRQPADFRLLESLEDELRESIKAGVPIVKLLEKLKEAGFRGGKGKLTGWLEEKGIRETAHRKSKAAESQNA